MSQRFTWGLLFKISADSFATSRSPMNCLEQPGPVLTGWPFQALIPPLLVDGVYRINQRDINRPWELKPAWDRSLSSGIQNRFGSGRIRSRTGFLWGATSIDYTFGLSISSVQPPSQSLHAFWRKFFRLLRHQEKSGSLPRTFFRIVPRPVYFIQRGREQNLAARIYFVREGDTLKSIAKNTTGQPLCGMKFIRPTNINVQSRRSDPGKKSCFRRGPNEANIFALFFILASFSLPILALASFKFSASIYTIREGRSPIKWPSRSIALET